MQPGYPHVKQYWSISFSAVLISLCTMCNVTHAEGHYIYVCV